MKSKMLHHWPFSISQDDQGDLYIRDWEEGLTFVREKINPDRYGLAVIIGEDNDEYWQWTDSLSPDPLCGFQMFDEISPREWNNLVKEYILAKHQGKQVFRKWIDRKLYSPIGKFLSDMELIAESMPYPDAPEGDWDEFNDFFKKYRQEQSGIC